MSEWSARALAGLVMLTCIAPAARAAEARTTPTIEVAAEAETETAPDVALVDFGVVTRADTASAAARLNAERMQSVIGALKTALTSEARLTTGTYALRPEYAVERSGGAPKVTGYVATNVVQVRTGSVARVGELIDVAVHAGSNQVQRVAFALSDPAAAHREALRKAVLQAKADAEAIASVLGVRAGTVQSLVAQDVAPARPLVRSAMVSAESALTTPIETGTIQVRARVLLTVEIGRD